MGSLGQGRGGVAPEQESDVGFKIEKGKVHTGKGSIIGSFLVDGEQVKGEISESLSEIVSAAERDASDRINRDRIPRQYQNAVKEYFSQVKRTVEKVEKGKARKDAEAAKDEGAAAKGEDNPAKTKEQD